MRHKFLRFSGGAESDDRARFLTAAQSLWRLLGEGAEGPVVEALAAALDEELEVRVRGRSVTLRTGRPSLRPLAEEVAAMAPAGWTVVTTPPPRSLPEVTEVLERELGARLQGARVRVGVQRGHLLDVVVHTHDCTSHQDEAALDVANLATELLLGQRVFDDWIGEVGVASEPRGAGLLRVHDSHSRVETHPLSELAPLVERAIAAIKEGLPEAPWHAAEPVNDWVLFELDPAEAGGGACDDLVLASTVLPEMLKCHLEEAPFASERFSRYGERFCAVVVAESGASPGEVLARRDALEAEIGAMLRRAGVGGVVGNGLGIRHSYLHLALSDAEAAVEPLRGAFRRVGPPPPAWLTFFDGEWKDEWVALGDLAAAFPGRLPALRRRPIT